MQALRQAVKNASAIRFIRKSLLVYISVTGEQNLTGKGSVLQTQKIVLHFAARDAIFPAVAEDAFINADSTQYTSVVVVVSLEYRQNVLEHAVLQEKLALRSATMRAILKRALPNSGA